MMLCGATGGLLIVTGPPGISAPAARGSTSAATTAAARASASMSWRRRSHPTTRAAQVLDSKGTLPPEILGERGPKGPPIGGQRPDENSQPESDLRPTRSTTPVLGPSLNGRFPATSGDAPMRAAPLLGVRKVLPPHDAEQVPVGVGDHRGLVAAPLQALAKRARRRVGADRRGAGLHERLGGGPARSVERGLPQAA